MQTSTDYLLNNTAYLRVFELCGRRATATAPATRGILPISTAGWWKGVKDGRFPASVKIGRATMWRAEDIRDLVAKIDAGKLSA